MTDTSTRRDPLLSADVIGGVTTFVLVTNARTRDRLIAEQLLVPVELQRRMVAALQESLAQKKPRKRGAA